MADNFGFTVAVFIFGGIIILSLLIYMGFVAWVPPSLYPADENKYRIKEKILKRGTSYYYVQYKWWFFFWCTYKDEIANMYGPLTYKDWSTYDVRTARAKITELIGDHKRVEGQKTDKIEYQYYNKGHFGDEEY